jgi:hypothetical protein
MPSRISMPKELTYLEGIREGVGLDELLIHLLAPR